MCKFGPLQNVRYNDTKQHKDNTNELLPPTFVVTTQLLSETKEEQEEPTKEGQI